MRTKFSKILSACLVSLMLASTATVAPITATAVDNDIVSTSETSGDFEYHENTDGTVEIRQYNGDATQAVIPSEIEGKKVTSIGISAFEDCTSLKNVTIPDSVTSLGYRAFAGCTSLEEIIIPDSVKTIMSYNGGSYAFVGCTSLERVTLSNNINSIGEGMFIGCTNLKSVNIPTKVTKIGGEAFLDCTSLEEIIIPDNVKEIDWAAFRGCTALKNIALSRNIIGIPGSVFDDTYWYNNQPDGVIYLGNVLYSYKGEMPENTIIKVLDGTRVISRWCFKGYKNLEDIIIPDSVINIGNLALDDTTWLKNQPDGIVYAGKVAYSYKGEVAENSTLELRNDTKGIAECFHSSMNVKGNINVILPDSLVCIGQNAFGKLDHSSSLEYLNLPSNLQYICSRAFSKCNSINNDITIPDTIQYIGEKAFHECDEIKAVYLPNSDFEIQDKAFGYTSLGLGFKDNWLVDNFKIYGYKGTTGEFYANKNGIPFVVINEATKPSLGDVNGDNKVSILDTTEIQKYLAELSALNAEQLSAADTNCDGKISILDATEIQKYLAEIITKFG